MYKRNIRLSYILAFLNRPWFWLGIWIFYYLRFTGYGGIGIIESILVATMVLTEIPTGAVADLLGKKKTLIMAFLLQAVGGFIFGFAQNIYWIGAAVFIAVVGGTFYSGTMEAFLYDSLKQDKKEKEYDKVQSRINSLQLLAPAVFGAIGGFMYRLSPGLPFLASGVFFSVAFLLAFLLKEPPVDTEKFSWASFVFQTKAGWRELTKSKSVKKFTILLLSLGFFLVIADEMLNSFLGVEFGLNAEQMGLLWSVIYLVSAFSAQLLPILRKKFKDINIVISIAIILSASFVFSPVLGIILGSFSLLLRSCLQALFETIYPVLINKNTKSKYRATTISTFNMIKNIPYLLFAYLIGSLSGTISARYTALVLGLLLLFLLALQCFSFPKPYRAVNPAVNPRG